MADSDAELFRKGLSGGKNAQVVLRRTSYGWGKFSVPTMDREYHILLIDGMPVRSTAVGTITEVNDYLEEQGYGMVDLIIQDKDKKTLMKNINVKKE